MPPVTRLWCWTSAHLCQWKGALHINDVAQAVMFSLKLLGQGALNKNPVLTIDSASEQTDKDLAHWDADGPGTIFQKYYSLY